MKVKILLTTYNSEKYISDLLDSMLAQTYKSWELLIHDDGSVDNTLSLIQEYIIADNRISLVLPDKKYGAAKGFMALLNLCSADYYFFCDHDDVWLSDKIEKTLKVLHALNNQHPELPIIVHSDLYVVNQDLQITNQSFWKSSKIDPVKLKNKNISQVFNSVTGCAMAFNNNAKIVSFPFPNNIPMHDWWLNLCVLKSGGIVQEIPESLIYYRQHNNNEVGAKQVDNKYFYRKILNLTRTVKNQFSHIKFLKSIGGLNFFQYYYYKVYYTIVRNI